MKFKSIFLCSKNSDVWKVPNGDKTNVNVLQETRNRWLQYATVISVSLMSIGSGAAELWISAALPYLKSSDFKFTVSAAQLSWIVSLFNIGEIIGFLLYPLLVDRIGCKYSLLASSLPQILSWALICVAKNATTLYLSRLIGGIGYGAGTLVQLIYVNEIAEKDIRGLLMSITRLAYLIGCIALLMSGAFFSYDIMNLIMISFPIIFILTFVFFPESPYFYLKHNRNEEAVKHLSKLLGTKDSGILNLEIKRMEEAIIGDEKCQQFALRNLFENKRDRKALIIVSVVKTAAMFSGANVIGTYMQDILSFTEFSFDPKYTVIILATIVIFCIAPIVLIVDFNGRRLAILYSSVICSSSLFLLGLFFFFKLYLQINIESSVSWIPLVALIILDVASIALICTSLILCGEFFSNQVKNTALAFVFITSQLQEFITKFSFENIVGVFGIYGVFWLYAVVCTILSLTGFYIAPETKGKTLEEIQMLLD